MVAEGVALSALVLAVVVLIGGGLLDLMNTK
jgi:hypothetical protein